MATRVIRQWRLLAAAGLFAVAAAIGGNRPVLAQSPRVLHAAKAADVRIDMGRLSRPRGSDWSTRIYISTTRMSDFDLAPGGVSHQKWEDVWVVPLQYIGEDGKFFYFKERISHAPWSWAFSKSGTNNRYPILVKTHLPPGNWQVYDNNAIRHRRYQPP